MASLTLSAGPQPLSATLSPAPPAVLVTATASWGTTTFADGAHTLTATATDQAGRAASATQGVIVDNTPPETEITPGPTGDTGVTSATFSFTGIDNLTAPEALGFAWRLDGGPFSAFSPATSATFNNMAPGPHAFNVKARDRAGNEDQTPAARAFTVGALRVTITTPAAGANVAEGLLLVRGTVEAGGVEVAVSVNGIQAAVQGTAFAALVPVALATTEITALATTAPGATASHRVVVTVMTAAVPAAVLYPNPSSGVAPLTVSFSLFGAPVVAVELDRDGDGVMDFTGAGLNERPFTYDQPGLYVAHAIAVDAQGNRLTASAVVEVLEATALDQVLVAKWTAMKDALRAGDVAGALEGIALSARDDYRDMLTGLGSSLSQIDVILTDVTAVSFNDHRAEYQMTRVDGGVPLSYFVLFVRDPDGIWRLKFF